MKRRSVAAIVTAAVAGTVVLASAGVNEASTIYRFRLSQFATAVAKMCVYTGAAPRGICSPDWAGGKSEIFDVPTGSLDNWYCTAEVVAGRNSESNRFSRMDTKECYLEGDTILSYFSFK